MILNLVDRVAVDRTRLIPIRIDLRQVEGVS